MSLAATILIEFNEMERISRREVLISGAAFGGVALLPEWLRAPENLTFAYYSDTHVSINRNVKECTALIREMRRTINPAFAINGGDVTDYGWKKEYDEYKAVLAAASWKTHHVPGNHDVRWSPLGVKLFNDRLGKEFETFEAGGVTFFLLDTTVPLSHWGSITKQQIDWLRAGLKNVGREKPVILAMHHWPGRPGELMVDNEMELLKVIEAYNIKLILTGHGHSDLLWDWSGFTCTMNKGLYQGSYQRCTVDWTAREVRLDRRTTEKPVLTELTKVSLAQPKARRENWALGGLKANIGQPVVLHAAGLAEYAWKRGEWEQFSGSVPTSGQVPGTNQLYLKDSQGKISTTLIDLEIPSAPVSKVWEVDVAGGVMSHLLAIDGMVLVSDMGGGITAFDQVSGKQIWRAKTERYCHSSPTSANGKVYIGSADGSLYCLNLKTGKFIWRRPTGGPVYASAAVAQGVVAVASGDGKIYGFDAETGAPKWTWELPVSETGFCQSQAATDGSRFFFGAWDNTLYALSFEGIHLWSGKCCADRTFHYSPAIGGPVVSSGRVVVPANGNKLYCFDTVTGSEKWVYSSPGDKIGYSAPVVSGGKVFVGSLGDKGEFRCVDLMTGQENWVAASGEVIYDSAPVLTPKYAAITSVSGLMTFADRTTGQIAAKRRLPPGLCLSSAASSGSRVFAVTYNRRLVCLST